MLQIEAEEEKAFVARLADLALDFEKRAEETDRQGPSNPLISENIRQLGELGFYGAGIPRAMGGLGLSEPARRESHQLLAAACGATAFAQQQLHSGGGSVGSSKQEELKDEVLPLLATGKLLCGICFAHLRRPGPPSVRCEHVPGGMRVSGFAPWVSVWSLLDSFILGCTDSDGVSFFVYVPIELNSASIVASEPMKLATMDAADTVSLQLNDLFVPDGHVLSTQPPGFMRRSDYCGITGHVGLPLGCARGSIRYLRGLTKDRTDSPSAKAADSFESELARIDDQSRYWNASRADEPEYKCQALAARSGAYQLAIRAAGAAIAATGGKSHLIASPPQRRWREASFYMTVALTQDVQGSLLEAFTHGPS